MSQEKDKSRPYIVFVALPLQNSCRPEGCFLFWRRIALFGTGLVMLFEQVSEKLFISIALKGVARVAGSMTLYRHDEVA